MRWILSLLPVMALAACVSAEPAAPQLPVRGASAGVPPPVTVIIDLSDQRMTVAEGPWRVHDWPVSTARAGKSTPIGTFRPQFLSPYHRSSIYHGAPMPWSIFFAGNFAIHGTDQVDRLGSPASAGCIRLHPENAKVLYDMVAAAGLDRTRIVVRR